MLLDAWHSSSGSSFSNAPAAHPAGVFHCAGHAKPGNLPPLLHALAEKLRCFADGTMAKQFAQFPDAMGRAMYMEVFNLIATRFGDLDDWGRHIATLRPQQLLGQTTTKMKYAVPPVQVMKPPKAAPARRGRGSYATTARESVLGLVMQKGSPTTQEINKHWASEGRYGTADAVLSHLVRDKQLKRVKLIDLRGSRYSLA